MEFIELFTFSVNETVKGSFLRSFTEITDKIFLYGRYGSTKVNLKYTQVL
jgi:hypothetical protein